MKKITASLALGLLGQHVYAAGFIEDSKATIGLRNFYINQDTRNQDANTQEEWGQGCHQKVPPLAAHGVADAIFLI